MSNPNSLIRVVLWRHGQTDWNVENRFQGHSDIPLNKVGEYQVAQAASVLAGLKPNRIISSDLIRAQATAAALADLTNLKVEINPGLRETNGGLWEGKTAPENRATHGATIPSANNVLYSSISSGLLGLLALQTIFVPSGLNHAPPSYPSVLVTLFSFPVFKSITYKSKSPPLS